MIEPEVMFAVQRAGLNVVDGQQLMLEVRKIKTSDEIALLNTACAMVDAAYDALYMMLRAGVRENDGVALVNRVLYELGSEHVEGVNAASGERTNPHPTTTAIASCVQETRSTSTSCTAIWGTARATTAPWSSAVRLRRRSMHTNAAGKYWIPPSTR